MKLVLFVCTIVILLNCWGTSVFAATPTPSQLSVKCSYEVGKTQKITIYLKNKNIRASGFSMGYKSTGNVLIVNNKMYLWTKNSKTGTVVSLVSKNPATQKKLDQSKAEVLKTVNQYQKHCSKAKIQDSVFVVPTGITFVDFSKQLQKLHVTNAPLDSHATKSAGSKKGK